MEDSAYKDQLSDYKNQFEAFMDNLMNDDTDVTQIESQVISANTRFEGVTAADLLALYTLPNNVAPTQMLPVQTIRSIIRDENANIQGITKDALVIAAKATQMFIQDLACHGYESMQRNRGQKVNRQDLLDAMTHSDNFDFLIDVVECGEGEEESDVESTSES